jgi:hypothetical protein
MTIIKLTTTRDESVHINADYIKLILTDTANETVIVFDTEMPNFDRNYKETPEEIIALIQEATQ